MKKSSRIIKRIGVFMACCVLLVNFAGCGQELTDSDIKSTQLYKDLETSYSQLERKYEKLASQSGLNATASAEAELVKESIYLKQIKNGSFLKVRYVNNADNRYEISDNESLCNWLKTILGKAIADTNENSLEFQAEQTPLYGYTLYNENNSVCQCQVYENDRVIFADLPDKVYYVEGICRVGRGHFGIMNNQDIPKRMVFLDMYESQLMYRDGILLDQSNGREAIALLINGAPKHLGMKPSDVEIGSNSEWIAKCEGNTFMMEVYTNYISITKNSSEVSWYAVNPEVVRNMLAVTK